MNDYISKRFQGKNSLELSMDEYEEVSRKFSEMYGSISDVADTVWTATVEENPEIAPEEPDLVDLLNEVFPGK